MPSLLQKIVITILFFLCLLHVKSQQQYDLKSDSASQTPSIVKKISDLQTHFDEVEKELQYQSLQSKVEKHAFENRLIFIGFCMLVILFGFMLWALFYYRRVSIDIYKKNEEIRRQNNALVALNKEKNQLLHVISHDLATPFASIDIWIQVLLEEHGTLTEEQLHAIEKLKQSGIYGKKVIERILHFKRDSLSNEVSFPSDPL